MQTWIGNWKERIEERLAQQGLTNVIGLCEAYPAEPYTQLADRLGDDIAAVQLQWLVKEEAQNAGRVHFYVRDALVRVLRACLPNGWGVEPKADFHQAHAWGSWIQIIGDEHETSARVVWDRIRTLAPDRWLPAADDPVIEQAFDNVRFAATTLS